jgi:hypothetical protein
VLTYCQSNSGLDVDWSDRYNSFHNEAYFLINADMPKCRYAKAELVRSATLSSATRIKRKVKSDVIYAHVTGWRSREACMFHSLPRRAVMAWLVAVLGPPPPPPRRYFSKEWDKRARHPAAVGRGGAGSHRETRRLLTQARRASRPAGDRPPTNPADPRQHRS